MTHPENTMVDPAKIIHSDTSIAPSVATKNTTTTHASSSIGDDADSMRAVRSDDERSLEEGVSGLPPSSNDEIPDIPEFTPPLRIARLAGNLSASNLQTERPEKMVAGGRRKSDPAVSSSSVRSVDGGSSISSIDDIDPDILTDKMGMLELDMKESQKEGHKLNNSLSNLPPLTERMTEETLDDCHAFSDLQAVPRSRDHSVSRGNSVATGGEVSSNVLEPLDEGDEVDSQEGDGRNDKIILTNMEEILEGDEADVEHHGEDTSASLQE